MNLASASTTTEQSAHADEENDVLIRSYTSVGTLQAIGKVEVEARETVIPDRRHVVNFVRVGLESMGDYPQAAAALIQYDHLPKLLRSLDKLAAANIKTDRFAFSEVEYEVDGLKIIVFNDGNGKIMFVISVDNVSVHFNSLARLDEFKALLSRAKTHLDSRKIEF
ncbi:MAG: hypothetical protein ACT6U0_14280 [Shinella sp.]|uniref:hypothetical protein n=1 Tax=Shinella sp. TaxID=1870904 RepID=UPI004035DE03